MAARPRVARVPGQYVGDVGRDIRMRIPIRRVLPKRTRKQRRVDTPCERRSSGGVVAFGAIAQCRHQARPGIAVKLFDNGRVFQCRLERCTAAGSCGPLLGGIDEIAPSIFTSSRSCEEGVNAPVFTFFQSNHFASHPYCLAARQWTSMTMNMPQIVSRVFPTAYVTV